MVLEKGFCGIERLAVEVGEVVGFKVVEGINGGVDTW